jgi:hypothetical protein
MSEFLFGVLIFGAGSCVGFVAAAIFMVGAKDKSDPPEWDEILHQQQQASVGRHQTKGRINKNDITWEI